MLGRSTTHPPRAWSHFQHVGWESLSLEPHLPSSGRLNYWIPKKQFPASPPTHSKHVIQSTFTVMQWLRSRLECIGNKLWCLWSSQRKRRLQDSTIPFGGNSAGAHTGRDTGQVKVGFAWNYKSMSRLFSSFRIMWFFQFFQKLCIYTTEGKKLRATQGILKSYCFISGSSLPQGPQRQGTLPLTGRSALPDQDPLSSSGLQPPQPPVSGSCVLTQQPGAAQSSGSLAVLDGIRDIQQWREGFSYGRGRTEEMWPALLRERRIRCQGLKPERLSFKVHACACACVCRELLTLALFLRHWTPNKAETIM